MRLKHVKNAKERVEMSKYLILEPSKFKGRYKELFKNDNPIYIEIGMGKGNFIINNAIKYPDINFIGIEKYDSVIVRAIEKLDNLELPNLKLIRLDANNILDIFFKEIDLIYLNFSDPWPKARHEKRRLSSSNFLKKYDLIFKDKNKIIMKTDNRKLFEYSVISYTDYGYKIKSISLDLEKDENIDNIETEYETKFKNMGFPIYKIEIEK